jgi:tRNA pseudouridine55 synthase
MVAPDGLLVVDKPSGRSSHDVVARCRRLAGTRKVGHAGTLDPMATGVLVVGVGRATRLLGYLALSDKVYEATIRLGQTTLTDDAEGDLLATVDASGLRDADVRQVVGHFTGELQQIPSAVSAIKVGGRRSYARVRAGEKVVLAPRTVQVTGFTVLGVRRSAGLVDVDVRVECSTGTYVRALARDVGAELGVGGHLTALRRVSVGAYGIERAHTLEELARYAPADLPVVTLDEAAREQFPHYVVDPDEVEAVRNGRPLTLQLRRAAEPDEGRDPAQERNAGPAGPVAVLAPGGHLLALYEQHGPIARPAAVFDPA